MARDKKKKHESDLPQEQVEGLVREAMLRLGWVVPVTPDEIARVEAELEGEDMELPPKLRDPYAVFDAAERPCPSDPVTPTNDDVVECLARAAREGKEISPEVEQRMCRDRERAEREANE